MLTFAGELNGPTPADIAVTLTFLSLVFELNDTVHMLLEASRDTVNASGLTVKLSFSFSFTAVFVLYGCESEVRH